MDASMAPALERTGPGGVHPRARPYCLILYGLSASTTTTRRRCQSSDVGNRDPDPGARRDCLGKWRIPGLSVGRRLLRLAGAGERRRCYEVEMAVKMEEKRR